MEATPDSVAFSLKVRHAILVDRKFSKSGIQEIIYERTVNFPGGFAFNFQAEKEGRFSTFSLRLQNCGEESVKIIDFKMGRFPIRNLGFLMKPGESLEVTDQLTYHQDSAKSIRIECLLEFESVGQIQSDQTFFNDVKREKEEGSFADATLICQGVEIPCHRFILGARSSYFKNMFQQTAFIEGRTRRVNVHKNLPTLLAVLDFCYLNKVDPDNESLSELLSAAHEYEMVGLMSKCDELMIERLNVENTAEYFYWALVYDRTSLKEACYDFLTENLQEVEMTDGWRNYENYFISVINEIGEIEGL